MRTHPVFRVLFGCVFMLVTASLAFAQPGEKATPLPEGLNHVPVDAMGFVHVRVGDFLKSGVGQGLLKELLQDREASKGLKHVEKLLGVAAGDIESVTVLMLTPTMGSQMNRWDMQPRRYNKERFPGEFDLKKPAFNKFDFEESEINPKKIKEKKIPDAKESPVLFQEALPFVDQGDLIYDVGPAEPLVIVTSTKPLDRKKILRTQFLEANGPGRFDRNSPFESSVVFLSDRSVLIGNPWELGRYSELMGRKAGPKTQPLKSALALGVNRHLVVAGGHLSVEIRRILLAPFGPEARIFAPLTPLMQTEAGLTLDLGKSVDLTLQFNASTEANAAHALQATKSLQVLAELALEKSKDAGESGGAKLELEKALARTLADAIIEQKGTLVRVQLKLDVSPAVFKHFTKDIVATFRTKGDRTQSVNNLKQIALAMHGYHGGNKRFPPAGLSSINDPMGKPLLSWRVAILPYIDQAPLYQQFDLTQSWDSPHNKKLIAKMPPTYLLPGTETKEGETHYRVLVGPSTVFELGARVSMVSITDGTSNTIMVVEAKEPTIWTRPEELPFDPKGPLPKFGVSPDGFNAAFCDGTVHFIRAGTPDEVLRAMITRNGGEAFAFPDER